jgi:hypothetical protein
MVLSTNSTYDRLVRQYGVKQHQSELSATDRIQRLPKIHGSMGAIDYVDWLGFIDRDEFDEGQVFIW